MLREFSQLCQLNRLASSSAFAYYFIFTVLRIGFHSNKVDWQINLHKCPDPPTDGPTYVYTGGPSEKFDLSDSPDRLPYRPKDASVVCVRRTASRTVRPCKRNLERQPV
jgi:hypothetical protein